MWMALASLAISAYSSYSSSSSANDAGKAQDKLNYANYQRNLEQYDIDIGYNALQNTYSDQLQGFAKSVEAWGQVRYGMAVEDRATEVAFREKQVKDKQFAAKVDFMAQQHVSEILQVGAVQQASHVVEDVLRTAQGNKRKINVTSEKMMGTIVAESMSGIAQGASKDRMIVEAFQARNREMGKQKSEARKSIIQVVNQKNKVINDTNLQTAASYRGLQAIMKLEPAPVAHVPPPMPVNTLRPPVKPVGPDPINGGGYTSYDSGANNAAAAAQIAGYGVKAYDIYSSYSAPSSSISTTEAMTYF